MLQRSIGYIKRPNRTIIHTGTAGLGEQKQKQTATKSIGSDWVKEVATRLNEERPLFANTASIHGYTARRTVSATASCA